MARARVWSAIEGTPATRPACAGSMQDGGSGRRVSPENLRTGVSVSGRPVMGRSSSEGRFRERVPFASGCGNWPANCQRRDADQPPSLSLPRLARRAGHGACAARAGPSRARALREQGEAVRGEARAGLLALARAGGSLRVHCACGREQLRAGCACRREHCASRVNLREQARAGLARAGASRIMGVQARADACRARAGTNPTWVLRDGRLTPEFRLLLTGRIPRGFGRSEGI
jgi:hypothetical protein